MIGSVVSGASVSRAVLVADLGEPGQKLLGLSFAHTGLGQHLGGGDVDLDRFLYRRSMRELAVDDIEKACDGAVDERQAACRGNAHDLQPGGIKAIEKALVRLGRPRPHQAFKLGNGAHDLVAAGACNRGDIHLGRLKTLGDAPRPRGAERFGQPIVRKVAFEFAHRETFRGAIMASIAAWDRFGCEGA